MNAIRVCADQLAILGDPVKPEDLIERVLEGLQDANYQAVIDAVNARDTLITFDELHEKLLIREVSLRTQSNLNSTPLPATALATITRYQQPAASRQYDTSYRNNTNQKPTGNYQKKNNSNKGQGYQGKCQWCHIQGHSLYRCPIFQERFPQARPTLPPPSNPQQPPQAHMAMATQGNPSTSWLLDSGASHHVTNDMTNLALHHPYVGSEEIVIGNGSTHGGTSYEGTT
ncbi:hypothetical protein ACHQM5_009424 [Ranunculus cassubicifolius]